MCPCCPSIYESLILLPPGLREKLKQLFKAKAAQFKDNAIFCNFDKTH